MRDFQEYFLAPKTKSDGRIFQMRTNRIVLSTICVLVISALFIFVSPVFAQDDELPTEQPAQTTGQNQAAGGFITPAPTDNPDLANDTTLIGIDTPQNSQPGSGVQDAPEAIETPVPDQVISKDGSPTIVPTDTTQPSMESSISDTENTTDTLSDIATALDDTNVMLATSSGEPLQFATTEANDLIATGDPYFKVGNTTYQFLLPGGTCDLIRLDKTCFISSTPIQDALNYMVSHNLTPTDRKLYIESGTYNEYVELDGSKNGIKGLLGLIGMGSTPEDVVINGGIVVNNFLNGFSLTNLSVINTVDTGFTAISFDGNGGKIALTDVKVKATGANSNGIQITTTKPGVQVLLNHVVSNNNAKFGAFIGNTLGETRIINSTFDNNVNNIDFCYYLPCDDYWQKYTSLLIYSWNSVFLDEVSASNNNGTGAWIVGTNVEINNSVFNLNRDDGLDTSFEYGDGLVVDGVSANLKNIQADYNFRDGIRSGSSSITGTLLHTDSNNEDGVFIDTCWDNPDTFEIECTNSYPAFSNISYSSSSFNSWNGFSFMPKGNTTMKNIVAEGNGNDGVYFESHGDLKTKISLDSLELMRNSGPGLGMQVTASINIKNITTYSNGYTGFYVFNDTADPIVISNATGKFNETRGNGDAGYLIYTSGPVSISNLNSYDNSGEGGYIDNTGGGMIMPVTIKVAGPVTSRNGIFNNKKEGLIVKTYGAVTITFTGVSDNYGTGAQIHNQPELPTTPGQPVTISDCWFDGNGITGGGGLEVLSKGSVTLANIRANGNGGYGISIDNKVDGSKKGVTLLSGKGKGNEFQQNQSAGLWIRTNGIVTITNIYAYQNGMNNFDGGYGVVIENINSGSGVSIKQSGQWEVDSVKVAGNTFSNNYNGGLKINTNGSVSVAFFHADENGEDGIQITSDQSVGSVTVRGISSSSPNVKKNGWNGVSIQTNKNILLSNIYSTSNKWSGLEAVNKGFITFSKIQANGNGGSGIYIENSLSEIGLAEIKLNNINSDDNGGDGSYILSKGTVTCSEINSINNSGNGVLIINENPLTRGDVVLSNLFTSENNFDGTTVITSGKVVVTNFSGNDNTNFGLRIDQTSAPDSLKPITLIKIVASHNGLDGIFVYSVGSITTNSIVSNSNTGHGIFLINNWTNSKSSITVLSSMGKNISNSNGLEGARIESNSNISVTGLETTYNSGDGIYLCNNFTSNTPSISLSSISSRNNGGSGINTISNGGVTVSYSLSLLNNQSGIVVQTNGDVRINRTVSMANNRSGIQVESFEGTPILKLIDSIWFGNLRNPEPEDNNLRMIGNWILIIQ